MNEVNAAVTKINGIEPSHIEGVWIVRVLVRHQGGESDHILLKGSEESAKQVRVGDTLSC
jgi:hypothetical protein